MTQWIISSSILIFVVIGLRFLLRRRIRPILQYGLWALVLVRLLVPVQLGSTGFSLENAVEKAPVVQQMELAEEVDHFVYHVDGTATGYYAYQPSIDRTEPEVYKPAPQVFTQQEAKRLNRMRDIKGLLEKVWLGGMAVFGLVFLLSNLRFALRLRKSQKAGNAGNLPIFITDKVETPCLFGLLRPAIYLPPAVAAEQRHRDYSVAHEMTHFRHGDALWSVLRCVCLVLHWYNPLVWWAAILSREDAEIACDDATIATLGEELRGDYGRVLVDLTCRKHIDLLQTATTMTGSAKGLKQRIHMIVKRPKMAVYALICLILVASVTIGCTFTGGKKPDPTQPTDSTENTDTTKPTNPVVVGDNLPDTITGTPLTKEELADFTEMFTQFSETQNWYRLLLGCAFDRPEDVDLLTLFGSGFHPYVEMTAADEAFLSTQSWHQPEADVYKLPVSRMEEVLHTYLGISLANVNRHYLDSMHYFAGSDCYFIGPGKSGASTDTQMIDGKRQDDGTVWLLSEYGRGRRDWDRRILCLKPQVGNDDAPYQVQSCQPLIYMGESYPKEVDSIKYVPYMYTGSPVTIDGQYVAGVHQNNYLYAYGKGQISYGPIHSFAADNDGHIYFIVQDQSQIIRYSYSGERMQIIYASGNKINAVACTGNNKLFIVEGNTTVLLDMTDGELTHLPPAKTSALHPDSRNSKYFLLEYLAGSQVQDDGYTGKPYTLSGMQSYFLYAVDDGVNYAISGSPVRCWTKDLANGYVYFTLKDDLRKVWRTDLHGQNRTLVYESQYGDVTFLTCEDGWLSMVENYNQAVLYDVDTQKLTVLMNAYKIDQFTYDTNSLRVLWVGKLNKDNEIQDWYSDGKTYSYSLISNEYSLMQQGSTGIPATPEP